MTAAQLALAGLTAFRLALPSELGLPSGPAALGSPQPVAWQEPAAEAPLAAVSTVYPDDEEVELAGRVLDLLNAARAAAGLEPLSASPDMALLAYQHSNEMAERGLVAHHSHRLGVGSKTRVKLAFPRLTQFGENVAVNRTPEDLDRALLASPGHRLNRLDPSFTHVGIGVARGGPYQLYLTEVFARVTDPGALELQVLYTEAPIADLPREQPSHGQVTGETVTFSGPGSDDPEYWTARGIDDYLAGRHEAAIASFQRALRLAPEYHFARFDLGRALLANGQPADAIVVLDEYLRRRPADVDAWWSVGTAALVTEQYQRAETAFRRVIAVRARDAEAWYNLGLSLEYQGRLDDAESAFAQALHIDSELHAARAGLSRVRR